MDIDRSFVLSSQRRVKNALRAKTNKIKKNLPYHMIKRDTHQLLSKSIDNNNFFNDLLESINFNDKYNHLMVDINSLFKVDGDDIKYNYCIGGSKAWYNIFELYYKEDLLSEYEKSAIHNNNTCDHYYFINYNDPKFIAFVKTEINKILNNFIITISQELNAKIALIDSNKRIELKVLNDNAKRNKLLFIENTELISLDLSIYDIVPKPIQQPQTQRQQPQPKSLLLLQSAPAQFTTARKPRKPRVTQAEIQRELDEEKRLKEASKTARDNSRSARASARSAARNIPPPPKLNGGSDDNLHKKILAFELNFRDVGDDLVNNIDYLIIKDSHYLNIYGLYLFLQIAKSKFFIRRESYNPFKIREFIYNKFILLPENMCDILFNILNIYTKTFYKYEIPNIYLFNDLITKVLKSKPELNNYITSMEVKIIECLRPYVNETISVINEKIKMIQFMPLFRGNPPLEGKDNSGIFVVGGDAIRRYDYDGSLTKDIDSKIYIPTDINLDAVEENNKLINECITLELFKLASYLNINKNNIFTSIPINELINQFENNPQHDFKCNIKFELVSSEPNMLNYRFRQSPKTTFPVDLYSLDYRCVIHFQFQYKDEEPFDGYYNSDISFIDVVLQQSGENYYKKYAVISNNLPISSLDFLLDDLTNTYNNDMSSLLRFLNGKSTKDYDRFLLLQNIKKKSIDVPFYTIDHNSNITYTKSINIRNNLILDAKRSYNLDSKGLRLYNTYIEIYNKLMEITQNKKKLIIDYDIQKVSGGRSKPLIKNTSDLASIFPKLAIKTDIEPRKTKKEIKKDIQKENQRYQNNLYLNIYYNNLISNMVTLNSFGISESKIPLYQYKSIHNLTSKYDIDDINGKIVLDYIMTKTK